MARVRRLAVWLHGQHVAWLASPRIGTITCEYTRRVVEAHPTGTPLLSCSLPVQSRTVSAQAFVTGLLPEGQHRLAMAQLAGVPTTDVLGLLDRFGRDVAGAVTVARLDHPGPGHADDPGGTADPAAPLDARLEPLTPGDLESEVARLPEHPLGLHDDSELSLAGLADKLLLVATDAGWARPVHGYPSTHLLKVDDRVHRGLVRAEHACLALARAAGIPAADSQLIRVGDAECIVVERFDRTRSDGSVARVHQEDACQALGIDPERNDRRGKYEAFGGPSLRDVASLLEAWGSDPQADLTALLDRVLFTVVIADADAHGKNVSLLHPRPGLIGLAPLYDTVPTALWPSLRTDAAMFVNGVRDLRRLRRSDLVVEATSWGLGRSAAEHRVDVLSARLAAAVRAGATASAPGLAELVDDRLSRLTLAG